MTIPELCSILDTCALSVDPIDKLRLPYNIFGSLSIENSVDEIGISIQV